MLIYVTKKELSSETHFKEILVYAWKKKILGFSIIKLKFEKGIKPKYCILKHYNPFFKTFYKFAFNTTSPIKLFPDKLHNVNGHAIKIGVIVSNSQITKVKDANGNLTRITGPFYDIIDQFFEHINASIAFVELESEDPNDFAIATLLN